MAGGPKTERALEREKQARDPTAQRRYGDAPNRAQQKSPVWGFLRVREIRRVMVCRYVVGRYRRSFPAPPGTAFCCANTQPDPTSLQHTTSSNFQEGSPTDHAMRQCLCRTACSNRLFGDFCECGQVFVSHGAKQVIEGFEVAGDAEAFSAVNNCSCDSS